MDHHRTTSEGKRQMAHDAECAVRPTKPKRTMALALLCALAFRAIVIDLVVTFATTPDGPLTLIASRPESTEGSKRNAPAQLAKRYVCFFASV